MHTEGGGVYEIDCFAVTDEKEGEAAGVVVRKRDQVGTLGFVT